MNNTLALNPSQAAKASIFKGSKSFSLASLLFDPGTKTAAWNLYSWCRYVDDQIDQGDPQEAEKKCLRLAQNTAQCFEQVEKRQSNKLLSHPWIELDQVLRTHPIPQKYFEDLLRGMRWDATQKNFMAADEAQLLDYCYCVAGTVGLMMASIMGVKQAAVLEKAKSLGIAMQLTNISRDIKEDFLNGRVYIPKNWLENLTITQDTFVKPQEQAKLIQQRQRLLEMADQYYEKGFQGIAALPFRAALAVAAAAYIYQAIGVQIQKAPLKTLNERSRVSFLKKLFLIGKAFFKVLKTLPQRF